jgi:hypothetical protein
VQVNFAATGGGTLSNTTATTDANGLASTTLIAGSGATQTVTATVAGAQPVTVSAILAPCTASRSTTVPGTLSRSLEAGDCQLPNGRYAEYFAAAVTSTPFRVTMSASVIPSLSVFNAAGDTVGFSTGTATANGTFKAFFAPATYRFGASTSAANATGTYTLTSVNLTTTDSSVTGCERVYITRGANSFGQKIQSTDCSGSYDDGSGVDTHWFDRYRIYLKSGETITIRMEGTTDHLIRVINANTGVVALQYDNGIRGTAEQTTFTAPSAGQWIIDAATYNNTRGTPETGTYKLTIT